MGGMKPGQIKARRERKAKVQFRKIARRIPDNVALANILLGLANQRPIQEGFYRNVRQHLRFTPITLEAIRNGYTDINR